MTRHSHARSLPRPHRSSRRSSAEARRAASTCCRTIRPACRIRSNPFVDRVRGGQGGRRVTRSPAIAQYLLSVLDTESNDENPTGEGGYESAEAAQAAWEATGRFNDKLAAEGYFVFANGLGAPKTATVVDGQGETPIFT